MVSLASNVATTGVGTNSVFSHHMDPLQTWSYWKERGPQRRFLEAAVVKARLIPNSRGSGTAGCSDVKVSGVCPWQWAELTSSNSDFLSRRALWHTFGLVLCFLDAKLVIYCLIKSVSYSKSS